MTHHDTNRARPSTYLACPFVTLGSIVSDSALLEADFTTERLHHDPGGCLACSAKEGTSGIQRGVSVLLRLEREVVLNLPLQRLRTEGSGRGRRHHGVDVAGVSDKAIVAPGTEIAAVDNLAAGGIDLDHLAGYRVQADIPTDGCDLNVAGMHIVERDRAIHRLDEQMPAAQVLRLHLGACTFQGDVSLQAVGSDGSGRRMQVDRGIGRN